MLNAPSVIASAEESTSTPTLSSTPASTTAVIEETATTTPIITTNITQEAPPQPTITDINNQEQVEAVPIPKHFLLNHTIIAFCVLLVVNES